jgi:hypothetical protein
MIFYHGTHEPNHTDVSCAPMVQSSNPKYAQTYFHFAGYHSYASEFYFAQGVGMIQETLLYIEDSKYWKLTDGGVRPNCSMGILFSANQTNSSGEHAYIDE